MNFSTLLIAGDAIFLGIMVLALGALMVVTSLRRRKYGAQLQEIRNNIKKGDKVMSETGIVGEVVDIEIEADAKYFTIKTGSKNNIGFIKLHSNAVYYVFNKDDKPKVDVKVEDKPAEDVKPETTSIASDDVVTTQSSVEENK